MNLFEVSILINGVVGLLLYTFFILDERCDITVIDRIATYVDPHEREAVMVMIGTIYYTAMGALVWVVE